MSALPALDHVGLAVPDLAAASVAFERLGFRLSPVSGQSGPLTQGGLPVPWGTANRCAMLRQGYVELLGIVDPDLFDNQLGGFLARYAGIHILAFTVDDAASAVERLRQAELAVPGIRPLQRMVPTPQGERQLRFKRVPLEGAPEGRIQLIEHETPELLWQAHLLDHPNRAVALVETVLCLTDLAEPAERFRRLTGAAPARQGAALTFELAPGRLVLTTPADLADWLPEAAPPTLPWFAGITIETSDGNAALAQILESAKVPFSPLGDGLAVPPDAACGAWLVFRRARLL